jgi:mono/diheme cytochrome c family protein
MKKFCVIIVAAMIVAVPLSLLSQNANTSAEIFKTRCASCHGAKGEGTLAGKIPAIKGTAMTANKLVAFITKGEGGKIVHTTPIVNIDDNQAKAVAEYVKNLK